jgi:formate dehydrogenase assembly factor FdhD
MQDVVGIEPVNGPGRARGIDLLIDPRLAAAAEALWRHVEEDGCGVRHALDCVPGSLAGRARSEPAPELDWSEAFRTLFAAAEKASPAGGLHACALVHGTKIVLLDTDVARHSAVDRVLGLAVQAGISLAEVGLLLSARLSGAMALKAAVAGVGWVASRSVATSLAAEIATAASLPVIQRAARRTSP